METRPCQFLCGHRRGVQPLQSAGPGRTGVKYCGWFEKENRPLPGDTSLTDNARNKKPEAPGPSNRKRPFMTKTKAIAIFVIVVGSLLYLKTVLYPPVPPWEQFHNAGITASRSKDYLEAEKQYKAALKEAETFPLDDWRLTRTLGNLAENYRIQGKHVQAEPHFKRALEIDEQVYGSDHPNVASHLNNLAGNYQALGKLAEAEPLFKRAWTIWEKTLGPDNDLVLFALKRYVDLLHEMGRGAEAERLGARLPDAPQP